MDSIDPVITTSAAAKQNQNIVVADRTEAGKDRNDSIVQTTFDLVSSPSTFIPPTERRRASRSDAAMDQKVFGGRRRSGNIPLRSCLKTKAPDSPPTKLGEDPNGPTSSKVIKSLRRVKTVGFDEISKPMLALPILDADSTEDSDSGHKLQLSTKQLNSPSQCAQPSQCPFSINSFKSSLADPVIIYTEVHVIAIAPNPIDEIDNAADPPTPTMQIVESFSGTYQIIWDDVPLEHKARLRRRASSASQSLQACSSPISQSLQRVNTKLDNWSDRPRMPSSEFRPAIVVFPDEDSRRARLDFTRNGTEDLGVQAPPNSLKTSAAASRFPSRPASAPMTRVGSHEMVDNLEIAQEQESGTVPELPIIQGPVPLDPECYSSCSASVANRRVKQLASPRRTSNVDEDELRFRGHRDSVSLARSRLLLSGGISPSLLAHRGSVST